jgi:hypothetical protein
VQQRGGLASPLLCGGRARGGADQARVAVVWDPRGRGERAGGVVRGG